VEFWEITSVTVHRKQVQGHCATDGLLANTNLVEIVLQKSYTMVGVYSPLPFSQTIIRSGYTRLRYSNSPMKYSNIKIASTAPPYAIDTLSLLE